MPKVEAPRRCFALLLCSQEIFASFASLREIFISADKVANKQRLLFQLFNRFWQLGVNNAIDGPTF